MSTEGDITMEYGIKQLSELAGVSARTLRYYDQIGLLSPLRTTESGYRYYGKEELKKLQQIMFYKERGFDLQTIYELLYNKEFNTLEALYEHLEELEAQQARTQNIISNVKNTIAEMKGEYVMSDNERFDAFKKQLVKENEEKYGEEIRSKYGDNQVDESNRKMMNLSKEQYDELQELGAQINERLEKAVETGISIESDEGKQIAIAHKKWLSFTWPKYSAEAHKGLVEMYIADERFKAYYDGKISGCAEFLRNAVHYWVDKI